MVSQQFLKCSAVLLFFAALPAIAEDVRWELVDTGVLKHSTHGTGIEMRIKPDPMPEGLFDMPGLPELMSVLCDHYAPSVIPFVTSKTELEMPEFIAVRVISGGVFGRYALTTYAISDNECGDEL
ncbi:MAG: hypothetical protein AAFV38_05815 [Pseudomonadota bacterium]